VEYKITASQLCAIFFRFLFNGEKFVISEVRVWNFVRRDYKHTFTLCIKYSVSVQSYKHGKGKSLVEFYLAVTYINIFTTCIKNLLHYYYYYYWLLLFRYIGLENCGIRN